MDTSRDIPSLPCSDALGSKLRSENPMTYNLDYEESLTVITGRKIIVSLMVSPPPVPDSSDIA